VKKNFARGDHDPALSEPRLQIYRQVPAVTLEAGDVAVQIFRRSGVAKRIGGWAGVSTYDDVSVAPTVCKNYTSDSAVRFLTKA
jgi:hypothetical protein